MLKSLVGEIEDDKTNRHDLKINENYFMYTDKMIFVGDIAWYRDVSIDKTTLSYL